MSALPLSGFKIPKEVTDAAAAAQAEASSATKAIKAAKLGVEQLEAAKATVSGIGSAQAADAARQAKQQALGVLEAAKYPNTKSIGIAKEEIAQLEKLAANFGGKDAVVQGLDKAITDGKANIKALEQTRDAADAKAKAIEPLKAFESNRSKDNLRNIESDLVKLKGALRDFENSPLQPSQPCKSLFSGLIIGLQQHVDDKAHEAECHACDTTNKIDRTDAAKAKVFAKIEQLKALAQLPNDSSLTTDAAKADYLLAKSIDQMSKTNDEKGETAGKMIGALICKRKVAPFDEVVIYGYSGVVRDQERAVTAEIARAATDLARQAAQDRMPAAKLIDAAANAALANQPDWAKPLDLVGGVMKSKGGAQQAIAILEKNKGGNNPVGVCAAPKMIQQAYAADLEPVALAEAWMGGGSNKDGELVVSCDTCMSNIGFQLCQTCK